MASRSGITQHAVRKAHPLRRWVALGTPVALAAARAGWRARLRRALPVLDGTRFAPVEKPVRVQRDRWGTAHIAGETLLDVYTAQGYVHGQDRLWQLELQRRMAFGTLSELFGPLT